jgi:hypothetical protein
MKLYNYRKDEYIWEKLVIVFIFSLLMTYLITYPDKVDDPKGNCEKTFLVDALGGPIYNCEVNNANT